MNIHEYVQKLQKARGDIQTEIIDACREATKRAVQVTTENTPGPKDGKLRGTNTVTGQLAQSWAEDSVIETEVDGNTYETILLNKTDYASYVENGHRLARHFVPGLVINPSSGLLEYNPDGTGGIVVGTQTTYVNGVFMADKGKQEYEKAVKEILGDRIKEILE